MEFTRIVRRRTFSTYILVLCAFYLCLVMLFHSNLQPGDSGHQLREVEEEVISAIPPDARPPRVDVPNYRKWGRNDTDRLEKLIKLDRLKYESESRGEVPNALKAPFARDFMKRVGGTKVKKMSQVPRPSDCEGPQAKVVDTFTALAEVWFYSAYWDTRYNDFDNKNNETYIRIMVIKRARYQPALYCLFRTPDGDLEASRVRYYEMCENHGKQNGGHILSCAVPEQVKKMPCAVRMSPKSSGSDEDIKVKLTSISPIANPSNFAICVAPIFGTIDPIRFVEFVELNKLLGANHVTIYDFQAPPILESVLQYYIETGSVIVVPWRLPIHANSIWYNGQLVAIQDCLYRNMQIARYVTFQDLDEFLIPYQRDDWSGLVSDIDKDSYCGYQFMSAFFDPNHQVEQPSLEEYSHLISISHTRRSELVSRVRTKCMVKPTRVFEAGIHHISKPILADLAVQRIDRDISTLHHHRTCLPNFGMRCDRFVDDNSTYRYAARLKEAVASVSNVLNLSET